MLLSKLIKDQLLKIGVGIVNSWEMPDGRRGVLVGDPRKYFPHPSGPQYPIDLTNRDEDPDLTEEEVKAIRRRFNLDIIGEIL
jgi:hypothetical protein